MVERVGLRVQIFVLHTGPTNKVLGSNPSTRSKSSGHLVAQSGSAPPS